MRQDHAHFETTVHIEIDDHSDVSEMISEFRHGTSRFNIRVTGRKLNNSMCTVHFRAVYSHRIDSMCTVLMLYSIVYGTVGCTSRTCSRVTIEKVIVLDTVLEI